MPVAAVGVPVDTSVYLATKVPPAGVPPPPSLFICVGIGCSFVGKADCGKESEVDFTSGGGVGLTAVNGMDAVRETKESNA